MTLLDKILSKSEDISQKHKFGYYSIYTTGSYVDLFMCVPIDSSKYVSKGVEKLCDKLNVETPKCLSWENIKENSHVKSKAKEAEAEAEAQKQTEEYKEEKLIMSL